jgi:predicted lysophospholipase L1 biosynthesis ABC-type transport system permease subunit
VISESVANTVWPGEDLIGRRIDRSNMDGVDQLMTIVGVVGDARYYGPDSDMRGEIYFNYTQRAGMTSRFTWIIETTGDPAAIGPAVMTQVKEMNPELPVRVRTMDSMLYLMLSSQLFNLSLLGVFAAVALTLAVIGIYGLIAYTVAHRTAEIGVRTALGARPGQVVWLFVRQSATLIGIGAVFGVLGAMATSRVLESLLFEVDPGDPTAYGGGVLSLVVPAMLAAYASARRAAKVDPVRATQSE